MALANFLSFSSDDTNEDTSANGGTTMTMYLHRVGAVSNPKRHTWEPAACALYAVAVGAGVDDTSFTLDTYDGRDQLVYPTFVLSGVLAAESMSWPDPCFQTGDYSPHELVLGEQGIVFHAPIPARGDVNVTTKVAAIYDKGSGALVVLESLARDNTTGQPMFTASTGIFVTGHGSFGGERGPTNALRTNPPDQRPDASSWSETSRVQTLIYRYAGNDRNPIHADRDVAWKAGYREPILMGQNTIGFAGRALVHELGDGDPTRLKSIGGRFAAAGYNGDILITEMWHGSDLGRDERGHDVVLFRVLNQRREVLVDRGRATIAS
jgi:acyl dehydratase